MKIINRNSKKTVASEVEVAKSPWAKTKGLMFREGIGEDSCLLMDFENEGPHSIWMFCMKFRIDVIFLDGNRRVTDIFEKVKPVSFNPGTWKVYGPSKNVKYILELKSGKIRKTGTKIGDVLSFI